jgi:adenylate cyclase
LADIFISYSSKDREKAEQLTELLASAGLSVWIDKQGIGAATSWSEEIVKALDECKVFVIMLSPTSIESKNVVRELALAFEKNKKILPLDLEPVTLPVSMQYHLAGLQRTPMTNIDSIIRALGKIGLEATKAPEITIVKETDGRKSLMILPFEDLSPTGDNGWFADGIVTELISALSNVKALHLSDAQATKEFKSYKGQLTEYARIMQVRYFVQGSVRKFGDQIKITAQLLDIDTGDYLWQHSLKGVMENIFDIQEEVAREVLKGLEVHLTSDEKRKLAERGTENTEAYELYLKAGEYYTRQTKDGLRLAAQLLTEAIALDPKFAEAYSLKANALVLLYRGYDRNALLLDESESLCKQALRLKPDLFGVYSPLSQIYTHRGMLTEAEETAKDYIRNYPQSYSSHFALGFFYMDTGQAAKAIEPYEESLRLNPDHQPTLWNLVVSCEAAGEEEKLTRSAEAALGPYERYLKLHPDDEHMRVEHAALLLMSGRRDESREAALKLTDIKDGVSLYNAACLFGKLGDNTEALRTFGRAIEAGFKNTHHLKEFLTDEKTGMVQLAGTPEYEEVKRMVEDLEREAETNAVKM